LEWRAFFYNLLSATHPENALSTCEIHSIYVLNGSERPSEIKLSKRYRTDLDDGTIHVYLNEVDAEILEEARVASFTTLFGKNGSGKTSLLTDLCQTCAPSEKVKPLGILFGVDDKLMLFKGRALSGWSLGGEGIALERAALPPHIDRIFYTTSPFESARTAQLKRYGVLNVSPSFETGARFDGLTLIRSAEHLAGSVADEWHKSKIAVRGWISREVLPAEMIDHLLRRHGYEAESGLMKFAVSLFKRWLKNMPRAEEEALIANLKIISDVEGNSNVVGRLVGELLGIAGQVRTLQRSETDADWRSLLDLSTRVIDESGFIPANGGKLIGFLRTLGRTLKEDAKGDYFDMSAAPEALGMALDRTEQQFPNVARFAADLGFLKFELQHLSSGQFALLYLYAAIGSALSRLISASDRAPVFLLIDEGEMFLHPAWQREYVAGLLDFISKFTRNSGPVHVVISTHSLIVAADSPPNTLFDVEKGEQRNSFGNGPRATLDDVYGVDTFAGKYTEKMVEELAAYLRNPQAQTTPRIKSLAQALANTQLRRYVLDAIRVRGGG
jgi:hypothetical protein